MLICRGATARLATFSPGVAPARTSVAATDFLAVAPLIEAAFFVPQGLPPVFLAAVYVSGDFLTGAFLVEAVFVAAAEVPLAFFAGTFWPAAFFVTGLPPGSPAFTGTCLVVFAKACLPAHGSRKE